MRIQRILAIAAVGLSASAPAAQASSTKLYQDPVFLMGFVIVVFVGLFVLAISAYRESQREYPPKS